MKPKAKSLINRFFWIKRLREGKKGNRIVGQETDYSRENNGVEYKITNSLRFFCSEKYLFLSEYSKFPNHLSIETSWNLIPCRSPFIAAEFFMARVCQVLQNQAHFNGFCR